MPGIVQSATNQALEIEVAGTGTLAVEHQASGVDLNAGTNTPVSNQGVVTGAGTATALAAPAASTQRTVHNLTAVNRSATPVTVMYKKDVGGTDVGLTPPLPLDPNWSIQFTHAAGFRVFNALGAEVCMAGYSLLKAPTLLTSGTTYTPSVNCGAILIELWGGGGAGGSADGTSGSAAGVGGGGGAGAYQAKFLVGVPSSITYALGAAGAAGAVGNNPGGNGGNTTCTINGIALQANGGTGGTGSGAAGTALGGILGGLGGTVANTNGDIQEEGENGAPGIRLGAQIGMSGDGASTTVGTGGRGLVAQGTGVAGLGPGAGGSGGVAITADVAGGAGVGGAVRIWEYAAA